MPTVRVQVRSKPDRAKLQLFYIDLFTGKEVTRSAKTEDRQAAERAAALWQAEIEAGQAGRSLSWETFCDRVDDEFLRGAEPRTKSAYKTSLDRFELLVGTPRVVAAIDSSTMSRYAALLERSVGSRETARKHLRHLKAIFRWAEKIGLIPRAPQFVMPRPGEQKAKGRPITEDEFNAMLKATPGIVGDEHAASWLFFLRGLWCSALRLNEALALSYDSPPARLLTSGKYPSVAFSGKGQKNRKTESCPIAPEFAALLATASDRTGKVFRPTLQNRKVDLTLASKTISAIGEAAGVVVNEEGKHGSAHDFRRSFGTRWALKVPPVVLQKMMRHASISTTLGYYVSIQVDDLGAAIWGETVPATVLPPEPQEQNSPQKSRK